MDERIRILFVDDEPRILEGLVRLFRPQRHAWEVFTADSGAQALELLSRQMVDVVVSDMRMPGMDGAELLSRVHARYPATVRIILSGQSEREAAMRRFGPCHQYLSKPCDPLRLIAAVKRACTLRTWLADPALPGWTRRIGDLPTLPAIYRQMVAELREAEPSLAHLAALVERDIGMAAHVLQTVNSTRFGIDRSVSSIAEAVALVGIEALRALVLAVHLFDTDEADGASQLDTGVLWNHSLATALLARAILQAEGGSSAACETAFTAGLLHDCGQLLLSIGDPDGYADVQRHAVPGSTLCTEEEIYLGMRHDRLGAWLLHHWELPDPVVEAVAWHHEPARASAEGMTPLAAVHIADALLYQGPAPGNGPDAELLTRLGMTGRLDIWKALAAQVRS